MGRAMWAIRAHRGLAGGGHPHAVEVGLEDAVAPGLQRVAHIDHDAAGDVGARVPALHLRMQFPAQQALELQMHPHTARKLHVMAILYTMRQDCPHL